MIRIIVCVWKKYNKKKNSNEVKTVKGDKNKLNNYFDACKHLIEILLSIGNNNNYSQLSDQFLFAWKKKQQQPRWICIVLKSIKNCSIFKDIDARRYVCVCACVKKKPDHHDKQIFDN